MRECMDCFRLLKVGMEIHGWRCPACHQKYKERCEQSWFKSLVSDPELDAWIARVGYVGLREQEPPQ